MKMHIMEREGRWRVEIDGDACEGYGSAEEAKAIAEEVRREAEAVFSLSVDAMPPKGGPSPTARTPDDEAKP